MSALGPMVASSVLLVAGWLGALWLLGVTWADVLAVAGWVLVAVGAACVLVGLSEALAGARRRRGRLL